MSKAISEPDFRALFAAAPGLYLVLSPDLTILAATDAYLAATMTVREQICGRDLFDVFPDNAEDASGEANVRASYEHVRRELTTHTMALQKYDIRRPDSEGGGFEVRYWSPTSSPVLDDRGKLMYIIAGVEDVTGKTGTEAALIENEVELEASRHQTAEADTLFTLSVDMLAVAGFDGYFKRLNSSWTETLGHSLEELMARPYLEFVHPDDRPPTEAEARKVATGKDVRSFENRFHHADGSYRTLAWSARPSVEENLFYAVARDVTDQKETEEALILAHADLERRVVERTAMLEAINKELEAFTYTVSHDLRAPLRVIDSMVDILITDHAPEMEGEAEELVRDIADSTKQMSRLIEDLLTFSQLGRQPVIAAMVAPRAIAGEAAETLLRAEPSERQVEITYGDLPECRTDASLLTQVYSNLLSNSLKYTRGRPTAKIEVGWDAGPGPGGTYFVRDNGVGFDMTYHDKMFGVFQRLHLPEDYEGTGVGLAIVDRIIARQGGRVWADGQPDKGATLHFTLESTEKT